MTPEERLQYWKDYLARVVSGPAMNFRGADEVWSSAKRAWEEVRQSRLPKVDRDIVVPVSRARRGRRTEEQILDELY